MKTKKIFAIKKLKPKTLDKPFIDTFRSENEYFSNRPILPLTDRYCKNCEDYKNSMKNMAIMHKKEIQNLTFLLQYKDITLKKRDEMLYEYNQENLELRSKIKTFETVINKANGKKMNFETQNEIDDYDQMNLNSPSKRISQKPFNNIKLFSQTSFSQMSLTRIIKDLDYKLSEVSNFRKRINKYKPPSFTIQKTFKETFKFHWKHHFLV